MLALRQMSDGMRGGRLLLFAASLLLTLLALELGVRAFAKAGPQATGYAPVNTDLRFGRPRNARGYRDLERVLEKPAGTRRLVVMGDSFAWGAGIEYEDTWGQRLERSLARRHGERWEAVNLALPGLSATDYAAQLPAEVVAYAPDVVVLGFVLNDAETKEQMKARERAYAERERRPPSPLDASALLRFVRGRLRATRAARERVEYHAGLYRDSDPGWQEARRSLKTMGAQLRERGVPWIVAIFPLFGNPLDERYPFAEAHARVAQAAAESGARVVDLLPAYRGLRPELLVVNGEKDEHPNEIAHRIAAGVLLRALDDVVKSEAR
jgi:lysophospholipase L1-like esterase